MQTLSMKVEVQYAILILGDPESLVPELARGALVASNEWCVVVGCMPDVDGETEIVVGDMDAMASIDPVVFDGVVALPTRRFTICTAENNELFGYPGAIDKLEMRVRADHPMCPSRVVVGLREG